MQGIMSPWKVVFETLQVGVEIGELSMVIDGCLLPRTVGTEPRGMACSAEELKI